MVIVNFFKKNYLYILIFVFLLFLQICSPYTGDDYGWSLGKYENLFSAFKQSLNLWTNYNGRVLGTTLVFALDMYPIFKVLIISLTFFMYIFLLSKVFENSKNKYLIFSLFLFLLMPIGIYRETFNWLSGFSNFPIPALMALIYIWIIADMFDNVKTINNNNYMIITGFLLGFFMNLFSEHNAIFSVILAMGTIGISLIFNKKILKVQLGFFIGALFGCCLMFASPSYYGHMQRYGTNVVFEQLNIFEKVIYNLKNSSWMENALINNSSLNLFISLIFILNMKNNKTFFNKFLSILFGLFNIFLFLSNIFQLDVINVKLYQFFICVIYFALLLSLLFINFKNKKVKNGIECFCYLLSSYLNVVPLLAAFGFGSRCFLTFYIFMILFAFSLIKNLEITFPKFLNIPFIVIIILSAISLSYRTFKNYCVFIEREKIMYNYNGIDDSIELPNYPYKNLVHQNGVLATNYHESVFKRYYGVNEDVKIIFK